MIEPLINDNKFYDLLGQQMTVAIVTDSVVKPKEGFIGFIIAWAHDRECYFQYGQPAGNKPQLFWSKICSLLYAVSFLKFLVKYNNFLSNSTQ